MGGRTEGAPGRHQ